MQQDDVEKLKKRVQELESEVEKIQEERLKEKDQQKEQPSRLNILNPAITAFLNGAGRIDDRTVTVGEGAEITEIDDIFYLRGGELDFRAAADPYVDAVLIVAIEQEANRKFAVDLEEGFAVVKKLPFLDEMPLGMRLKMGRYRPALGLSNTLHMHDLPWTTRPQPVVEYLGAEAGSFFEAGASMDGGEFQFRLPSFESTSLDLNLGVVRSGDIVFTSGNKNEQPAFRGRLAFFAKMSEEADLTVGLSGYHERGRLDGGTAIADVLFRWRPTGEFRSLMLGGEFFYVDREFAESGVANHTTPFGYYLFAQYQFNWHLYAGLRYDHVESIKDEKEDTRVYAGTLSYYFSEYVRFRLGYERRESDVAAEDGLDSVFLEFNVVIGSHPPEPFWVIR